ncbi:MAG: uroporphyrinogen-III C-methyltransferase [Pseudomonadota bacterium]
MSDRPRIPPQAAIWPAAPVPERATGFAPLDAAPFPDFAPGTVWLAGAGPGAPGLLTLLAYHAITHADVVVHDALVGEGIMALVPPAARRIHAGKRGGKPSAKQADITDTLIVHAREGARVLRLKGGDPFMFGRGGEEAGALRAAGIAFRIVPGVSAGLGGLAYAGIPATHRDINQAVTFLTGHDLSGTLPTAIDWDALARAAPVIVMYMAAKHLTSIAARLLAAGRPATDPVGVIANATLPDQQLVTLTLAEAATPRDLPTPAVIVVGAAVTVADSLGWFDAAASRGLMG